MVIFYFLKTGETKKAWFVKSAKTTKYTEEMKKGESEIEKEVRKQEI